MLPNYKEKASGDDFLRVGTSSAQNRRPGVSVLLNNSPAGVLLPIWQRLLVKLRYTNEICLVYIRFAGNLMEMERS